MATNNPHWPDSKFEPVALLAWALPDGMILTDEQRRVAYANPSASRLLAYPEESMPGATLEDCLAEIFLRAHQPQRLQEILDELAIDQEPTLHEVELNIATLSQSDELDQEKPEDRFLRFSFFPVHSADETAWRWGVLVHDTTSDRTADKLKNEFVAVVSHELRTPLSAMQGFSELLLTQDATAERRRVWLEMINRESVRLSSLIDDMLSLSHIESGRVDLRLERIDLEPVIRQCVEILRVGSSRHSFKIEIEDSLPSVRVDRDKLIQILNNIIGNAIKYSNKGGLITIRAGYRHENSHEVQVSVADQGIGIPQSEIPKVFEKFYRVSSRQGKEVKGTGLGLAITRKLVDLMGGTIWVESKPGHGSTFYFIVPTHVFPQRELNAFKEILLKTLLVPHKDSTEAELYLDYLQRTLPGSQLDLVLRDALYEVGERWHRTEIGIGDEHFATNVVRDFLSRMRANALNINGLRVMIGGVAGEEHVIGIAMVANAFSRAGWNVTNLGANVPVSAFITTLAQAQPDVLLLSIATSQRLVEIKRVVHQVREAYPSLIIGIGGRLLNELPNLAQRLNADFHATTPEETVRMSTEAVQQRKNPNNFEVSAELKIAEEN